MSYFKSRFARNHALASFPPRHCQVLAAMLGLGVVVMTGCARTDVADHHQKAEARAVSNGDSRAGFGDGVPNPGEAQFSSEDLKRVQDRLVPRG